jgi:hypothetical protein
MDKKASDGDLEARDDTVKDSPPDSVCTESGKCNGYHEFLLTWRHGFAATPEDHTPYSLTCQSTPHSKPHLDNEYPHSFSWDRHPAAAEVVQRTMTVDTHQWLCGHRGGHFLQGSNALTDNKGAPIPPAAEWDTPHFIP